MNRHTYDCLEPYQLGTTTSGVILHIPSQPSPTVLRSIEGRMDHLKPDSCWLHEPSDIPTMYSSVIPSQPQNSRLSQLNTPGYSAHPGQFSVRAFKTPTLGSYYTQPPKYDPGFQRSAASSDYYSSSRYEDPTTRFPSGSDPQRPSQYAPPAIRTSNLTARDFPSRPATQSTYTISRGNITDTYIYEQSDRFSQSEYDDTASNGSYSPSPSPTSSAMSTDSMLAIKSPLPSPLTEREERGRDDSAAATRRGSISGNSNPIPVPPLPGVAGSTMSRSYPGQSSGNHEDGPLRSGLHATSLPNSTTPIPIPPSTSTSDSRSTGLVSGVSYTTTATTAPPSSSASTVSVPPVPQNPSGGYAWHTIPTVPPSEAESEDVSLEARMNAEYNSVATGSLYTSPGTNVNTDNTTTIRLSTPVPPAARAGGERKGSGINRPEDTRLHITVPGPPASEASSDDTITESVPMVARSPASSAVVESLEEGRATGYMNKRNSTVVVGDQEKFLPSFADDRWINEQAERERQAPVSYSRVPVPPPAPELRREYSTSRSLVSSANATYNSSPPRATVVVQLAPPAEEQRLQPVPPIPIPSPPSRPRRGSQAGYSVPPPKSELSRRPSDTRSHAPPSRSSPPRQAEPKLDASPRRRTESALGLQFPETTPSSSNRTTNAYPSANTRSETPPSSRPEPYISSRHERRASPPNVLAGEMLRPQTTSPEPSARSMLPPAQHRSQSNSPPGKYRVPPPSSNDPYRTTISDSHRTSNNVPYRPQSTAPLSNGYRTTTNSSEPYRSQSTAPQETSYRPQSGRQPPGNTYTVTPISSYVPQTSTNAAAVPTPSYPNAQPSDPRVPSTRPRANSGSWSRNASFGSTTSTVPPPPPASKTPSPPSRHAQPVAPRQNTQPNTHSADAPTAPRVVPTVSRERGPPPSYTASANISTSPPQGAHPSISRNVHNPNAKHRGGGGDESDSSTEKGTPQAKPTLTVRNPSPPETSSERSSSPPHAQQPSAATPMPQNSAKSPYPPAPMSSANVHPHVRRSTLPYDPRTAGGNGQQVNDYGRRTVQFHPAHEQPQRRLSDGDQTDRPSFSFNPNGPGRNPPLGRSVRWNDNLICPSPIFPNRRKGWFNRRGDQLWTNEGAYKPPPPGDEYPPDLDDYPEYGEGWMNECGVRIDKTHHLIPKAPLRSALKQPKAIS